MKDMRAVRFNEKVKRLSTIVGGFGVAFVIGALSRWYDNGLDLGSALWIFIGAVLMMLSVVMNEILISEDLE